MQTGKRVGRQEAASPDQKIVRRQSDVGGRQTVNGKRLRWTGVGDGAHMVSNPRRKLTG